MTSKADKKEWEYGDQIPFGDPYWYQGLGSLYYKETHKKFRAKVRAFVEKEIVPFAQEWEEGSSGYSEPLSSDGKTKGFGDFPRELYEKAYKAGVLGAVWPKEYGGTPPEDFDAFHDLILWDELSRCGAGGVMAAVFVSSAISLPPILDVGSQYVKDKVLRDVITGKKIICFGISEPLAGSDVANIRTTAKREGDYYIVNGEKKFITSGCKADYYVVAVRTGGSGMSGITLLLLEKEMPGITARRLKTQGWWTSNTALLIFENVKVPAKNIVGVEGGGFLPIMHQFNHERFIGMVGSNRAARVCLEEAIRYARNRKTFGKRLADHQVIRHKISEMARRVEATHAMIEQVAYQFKIGVNQRRLAILTSLTKVQATLTQEFCAREASQILGGASYIRGGPGEKVERIYREVRVNAIGGGSEEIMRDFAVRAAAL